MEEYVSYDEIVDYAQSLQLIAEKMSDTYLNIINSADKLQLSWTGNASSSYIEEFQKLKSVLYPSYEELVKSLLFLISVSDGYKGLETTSAKKLLGIVDSGNLQTYNETRHNKKIEDINTVGKVVEE